MTKLYAINIALGTVSPAEIGIVVTTVAIILIGIALYVYNYRAQLKVFFYMDTQGSVYNSKGLEIYLKRNKRRLKSPTIVVVNLKNIDFLYQNYQKKTYLVTSICDTLLKGMTKIETVARIELGKYICIYSSKERQEIKDKTKQTLLAKYGVEFIAQSSEIHSRAQTKYLYDNERFDSFPELAV